jgi:hypothetical protein
MEPEPNRNFSKVETGTITFQKSEPDPEPYKIVRILQHCLYFWIVGKMQQSAGEPSCQPQGRFSTSHPKILFGKSVTHFLLFLIDFKTFPVFIALLPGRRLIIKQRHL